MKKTNYGFSITDKHVDLKAVEILLPLTVNAGRIALRYQPLIIAGQTAEQEELPRLKHSDIRYVKCHHSNIIPTGATVFVVCLQATQLYSSKSALQKLMLVLLLLL